MDQMAQLLAEQLEDIEQDIESATVSIHDAETHEQYQASIAALEALRRDRAAIVEGLEALGLEDPEL